jgi:hypothetical protein
MRVSQSTETLGRAISARTNEDRSELRQIGKELKSAEGRYKAAIRSGDEGAIAEANMDYEKSAQRLKARVEMNAAINRLINSIVEKIGQIR